MPCPPLVIHRYPSGHLLVERPWQSTWPANNAGASRIIRHVYTGTQREHTKSFSFRPEPYANHVDRLLAARRVIRACTTHLLKSRAPSKHTEAYLFSTESYTSETSSLMMTVLRSFIHTFTARLLRAISPCEHTRHISFRAQSAVYEIHVVAVLTCNAVSLHRQLNMVYIMGTPDWQLSCTCKGYVPRWRPG
jgi:hypothetical protein